MNEQLKTLTKLVSELVALNKRQNDLIAALLATDGETVSAKPSPEKKVTNYKNEKVLLAPIELMAESDKAYHITYNNKSCWLPKSRCELDGNSLFVEKWIATSNELIS